MNSCSVCFCENNTFTSNKIRKCNYNVCNECYNLIMNINGYFKCLYNCPNREVYNTSIISIPIFDPFEIHAMKYVNMVCSIFDPFFSWILETKQNSTFFMFLYIIFGIIITFCVLIPIFIISVITGSIMYYNKSDIAKHIVGHKLFPMSLIFLLLSYTLSKARS